MNYTLQEQSYGTPNQVVLARANLGRYVMTAIFLLLGIPILAMGGMAWLAEPSEITIAMTGMGAIFTAGGLLLLSLRMPRRFIFDNERGALLVEEKGRHGVVRTPLPYDDIEGFQVRTYFVSTNSNTPRSRTQPRYAVDLVKTDGAFWMLYTSGNRAKSQEVMDSLVARVELDRPFSGDLLEQKPPRFQLTERGDYTEVRWKRYIEWSKLFGVVSIVAGFGLVVYAFHHRLPGVIFWLLCGFLGLIGFSILYHTLAGLGKYQVVRVSSHDIEALQTGLPMWGTRFSMRLDELKSIQFNFSLNQHEQVLYFLRGNELELFDRGKRGDVGLGDILAVAQTLMGVRKLSMAGHTIGEMLYVEHLLQELIAERTGQAPA